MLRRIGSYLDGAKGIAKSWKTPQKILVIESDDWGALRQKNSTTYHKLLEQGVPVDKDPYDRYDCLESSTDLSLLANTLKSIQNSKGQSPLMTMNTVMANPDFQSIKNSDFKRYSFVNLKESYELFGDEKGTLKIYIDGINKGVFKPQFHGREHLNVPAWLRSLRGGDPNLLKAFDLDIFGITSSFKIGDKKNVTRAFDSLLESDVKFFTQSVIEGLEMFKATFGFSSRTMIAPSYTWNHCIEEAALEGGVTCFQGIRYQFMPSKAIKRIPIPRYTGQRNQLGQTYLVRNCFFEPSFSSSDENAWKETLRQIRRAFFLKQPAILSTHRLNFIGGIQPENRAQNLKQFHKLLTSVVESHPEVIFMSSDELYDLIDNKKTLGLF